MKNNNRLVINSFVFTMLILQPTADAIEKKEYSSAQINPKLNTISTKNNPHLLPDGYRYASFFRWMGKHDKDKFFEIVENNFPIDDVNEVEKFFEFSKYYSEITVFEIDKKNVSKILKQITPFGLDISRSLKNERNLISKSKLKDFLNQISVG